MMQDVVAHTAQDGSPDGSQAPGPHDDVGGVVTVSCIDDYLPRSGAELGVDTARDLGK